MWQIQHFRKFIFEDHQISANNLKQNFEDLIFVGHTLSTKTAKFVSPKNLYEYGINFFSTFTI